MKIKNLSIICDAMSNLINACMDANITTDEIQRLSEMDNEFEEHVIEISNLFTIKPTPTTSTPNPDTQFLKPETNDFVKDTSYDGNRSPITNDTTSKETVDKSNTDTDVKERKTYKVKPNDYQDAVTFIENNKDAIATDIDAAYNKYHDETISRRCTKKTFLEIVDLIYPGTISSSSVDDCIFVLSPYEGILVNKRGEIRVYDEKKNEYKNIATSLCNGYMSFHYKYKRYSVGRTVLSTFVGEQSRSYRVIYKDNNRRNCALSNLEWNVASPRTEGPSSDKIEIVCKIILELFEKNDTIHFVDIIKCAIDNKINISSRFVHKLMDGKYKDISDDYFDYNKLSIDHGEITMIDNGGNTHDDMDLSGIITDNNGDILSLVKLTRDMEYGKKLFLAKSKMNMLLGNNDFIIPIMYCLRDENGNIRHPNDILKAIRNEFGKFFITIDFVSKVLFKEYLPEVTDIWFSKEENNK